MFGGDAARGTVLSRCVRTAFVKIGECLYGKKQTTLGSQATFLSKSGAKEESSLCASPPFQEGEEEMHSFIMKEKQRKGENSANRGYQLEGICGGGGCVVYGKKKPPSIRGDSH